MWVLEVGTIADMLMTQIIRIPGVRMLWARFPFGSVPLRVKYDVWDRPHYAFGIYSAAVLARKLGLPGITVIEFGVAGGNGLMALERIAARVGAFLGLSIEVYGFDTGEGMPSPKDCRDLPYIWDRGFFRMNRAMLVSKLSSARLVIGNVEETAGSFQPTYPIGFIAFDLDYYSSTNDAFQIFRAPHLPRVFCYFDDTIWPEAACYNEYIGELCAIREFNEENRNQKLCKIHGLIHTQPHKAAWNEATYVLHDFGHPLYCVNLTPSEESQLPLISQVDSNE
jgi:hypothetical protein